MEKYKGEALREFNNMGKLIYSKDPYSGYEEWYRYDDKGNIIHTKKK